MLSAIVGYWSLNGLQMLRFRNGRVERLAEGALDELKPYRGLGKKVLIVTKELLHHKRVKYPPMPNKNIDQAIQSEIEEIFPLKNPGYFFSISQRADTYTIVDLWAWESSDFSRLRSVFAYDYVMPEDIMFISDKPELTVCSGNHGLGYVLAHSKSGFLGSTSFTGSISPQQIEVFFRSLAGHRGDIHTVNLYDQELKGVAETLAGTLSAQVVYKGKLGYPPSVSGLASMDLKDFKSKSGEPLSFQIDLAMRVIIYLILSYTLVTYLTGRNYTNAIQDMSRKIDRLTKNVAALGATQKSEDQTDVLRALEQKLKKRQSPLAVMNLLAKNVPDKSFVNRVVMNENSIELSLTSKEPVGVIRALEGTEGVKTVKLRGSPAKDTKGLYTFMLFLEMK